MRTLDATLVNAIVNTSPAIMAALHHDPAEGPWDAQPFVDCIYSVILLDNREDAAGLFQWSAPDIWQVHTIFSHTCRGRRALETGCAMLRSIFTEWEAEMVWGHTPKDNRAAHWFNRQLGAEYVGEDVHHHVGDCLNFRVRRDEWMKRFG